MIYSYYFDRAKQNRIEFSLQILDWKVEADSSITTLFSARIREIKDDLELRNESKLGNFNFPAGMSVDVYRLHIAEERKWLLEVKNNKHQEQDVVVGIIAKELNGNPIGLDVIQKEIGFESSLRANNLAVVENSYVSPEISQTITYTTFDTPETPIGLTSSHANYITSQKHYEVKEFLHLFPEEIDARTKFSIEMNLAPVFVDPIRDTIFELEIHNVGILTLQKSYMKFLQREIDADLAVRVPFIELLTPEKFYSNGFTSDSKLEIRGDGKGTLTILYAGKQISTSYLADRPIRYLDMISRERSDELTASAFADKYTGDLMAKGEILASGTRIGIAGEWEKENVADGNEVTAWASDAKGIDAEGMTYVGIQFTEPRTIKKITFRQSPECGSDHVSVKAYVDEYTEAQEVTTRETSSQDYVEIEIEQDILAKGWIIVTETPIVSFPNDGRSLEDRIVNEPWIVYDLQMMEAAPNAVLNLSHTINDEGDVILGWNYADLTGVTFHLYNHGVDTGYKAEGKNSITMTGLEREVEHVITVVAEREGFNSFESEPTIFTIGYRQMNWDKVIPVKLDNVSIKFYK